MGLKSLEERRAEKAGKKLLRSASTNTKKAVAQKARLAADISRVKKNQIGYCVEWDDREPLGEDSSTASETRASNSTPTYSARLAAQEMWDKEITHNFITQKYFTWEGSITLEFWLPHSRTKKYKKVITECFFKGPLKHEDGSCSFINTVMAEEVLHDLLENEMIPDGHKNKGVFRMARYKFTCVGE
jgi:hypothetical protein